jgi:hypothetical protein
MKADFQGTVYQCRLVAVVVSTNDAVHTKDQLKLVVQRTTCAMGINWCHPQSGFGQANIM